MINAIMQLISGFDNYLALAIHKGVQMPRQCYYKFGATIICRIGWADNIHVAAVVFNNAVDHGQSQACTFARFLGGEEGLQDAIN